MRVAHCPPEIGLCELNWTPSTLSNLLMDKGEFIYLKAWTVKKFIRTMSIKRSPGKRLSGQ